MRAGLFVSVFISGSLLIVFNELVARRLVNRSRDKFNIEINEKRARIICIMLARYMSVMLCSLCLALWHVLNEHGTARHGTAPAISLAELQQGERG
jgi:hypothetical protein